MTQQATRPPESLQTVRDVVEQKAAENGTRPFLRYHEQTLTYAELEARTNIVANELLASGVEPNDHVCLFLYNSLEHVVAFFALAKIGAVVVPVDTRFTDDTLAHVLTESGAELIMVDSRTRAEYEVVRSQIPNLNTEYLIAEGDADHSYRSFTELLNGDDGPPETTVGEADALTLTYEQQHLAEKPKGVLMPQYSYVNTGWEAAHNLFDYASDDRIFTTLPLYSIFTFQLGVMGALLADAEFALGDKFDPSVFWDRIDEHDATVFLYLSRMLSVLYNQDIGPVDGTTPAEMAIGASTGFTPDVDLFRNFEERFDIKIYEGYGSTQTSTLATYNRPGERKLDSVGRPPSYVELEIVDENDRPVPAGEKGEIVVRPTRSNTMMMRYYKEPRRTVEDWRNQWIHTGGIGYVDEDGYLYFVTTQENAIYRGRIAGRISAFEIETVIDTHSDVKKSAVIGVLNDDGSEDVKAVVVPAEGTDVDPVDISKHCERHLPYLKVPRYVEIRDDLPRGPAGKVLKEDMKNRGNQVWDRESGYGLSH